MTMPVRAGFGMFALAMLAQCTPLPQPDNAAVYDLLITGGTLFDGSGEAAIQGDIAISGDRIVFIGDSGSQRITAREYIDATGLVIAPGFIDPHTHADGELLSENTEERANPAYAYQGVTTVVIGNDGHGEPDIAKRASQIQARPTGSNVAFLTGFGAIRKQIVGEDNREPSASETSQMEHLVASAMCDGAIGFSAGLYYTPQNFSKTGEVIALAKVAAQFGGYYDTHLRDESNYNIGLEGAVEEALEIGRVSGAAVHISHIKALGPPVWGMSDAIIARINAARAKGQRVSADQYPWDASGTRVSAALVPRWALDGGMTALRQRLKDPEIQPRLFAEMANNLARRGGAEKLLITRSLGEANAAVGLTLAQIAKNASLDPIIAAAKILEKGDAAVASFNMDGADINAFAQQDWVVTGSDGSNGHPRKYASFPKAYRDFVRKEKLMMLPRFIRRSSGQTADILGLTDRGYLRVGYFADILAFDPETFAPSASYQQPELTSKGVVHLWVNGIQTITGGKIGKHLPGRALLKPVTAGKAICAQ